MTYAQAVKTVQVQESNIRRVNGIRFEHNGYEYRLTWRGGFAAYVAIDRRKVGKRNFEYFSGVGAYNCWTVGGVLKLVQEAIEKKEASK